NELESVSSDAIGEDILSSGDFSEYDEPLFLEEGHMIKGCALRGDLYYTALDEPTLLRRRKITLRDSPCKGAIRLPRLPQNITAASGYLFIVMKKTNEVFMLDGELESLSYVMTMEKGDIFQDASVHNGTATAVLFTGSLGLLIWQAETETTMSHFVGGLFPRAWRFVPYTGHRVCAGIGRLFGKGLQWCVFDLE
ncbi:hypothetical protein FOZ63_006784, partial [Perkinsus olseni]